MAFVTAALLAPCGVAPWRPLPSSGRRGANKGRSSRSAARPAVLRRAAEGDKALAAEQAAAAAPPAPAPVPADAPIKPAVGGKGLLAGGAVGLGVALFLAARLTVGGPSFAALEAGAVPLDAALSNGRPTVLEFYADWCEVCRELLPLTYEQQQAYRGQVNFVALNVENAKWAPELLEYGVKGIPEYVFLDANGKPVAAAVGKLPREVLVGNTAALAEGKPLPYARIQAAGASGLQRPEGAMAGPRQANPLDHS
ncbi:thioredoxin chloroplastic [Micractinium conductrix]|uniref:Thioredoxin chloroplastic n=1 Tax=Micractinium conductrix TaxID=554055 RepID=A0A2P6VBH2_9CHLO|nr:thioredoxin chloroplastic [Micractinium conductrix]|eukprot:PSC71442.1 thioredoxin chloroplastic [Micractinium conductrix]